MLTPRISFMQPGRLWLLLIPAVIVVLYLVLSARLRSGGRRVGRTRLDLVLPASWPGTFPKPSARAQTDAASAHWMPRPEIERLPAGVRDRVVVDASDSVLDGLHIRHVPSAVLLGMDRLLAGGPVAGVEQIDQMVSEIEQEFRAAADAASEANA